MPPFPDVVLEKVLDRLVDRTRASVIRWETHMDGAVAACWRDFSPEMQVLIRQPSFGPTVTEAVASQRELRINGCLWIVTLDQLAPLYDAMLDAVATAFNVDKMAVDPDFAEVGSTSASTLPILLVAARSPAEPIRWAVTVKLDEPTPTTDAAIRDLIKRLGLEMPPMSWSVTIGARDWPDSASVWPVWEEPQAEVDRRVPRHDDPLTAPKTAAITGVTVSAGDTIEGTVSAAPRYWLAIEWKGQRWSVPIPARVKPPAQVTRDNLIATLGYIGAGSLPEDAAISLTVGEPQGAKPWQKIPGGMLAGAQEDETKPVDDGVVPLVIKSAWHRSTKHFAGSSGSRSLTVFPKGLEAIIQEDRADIATFIEATFKKHGWVRHPNYAAATETLDEILRGLRGEP